MRTPLLTLALASTPVASRAWAQDAAGFDAHGFQSAAHDGDVRDPLVARRPGAMTAGDAFGSLLGEYARAPLVRVSEAALSGQTFDEPVLDHVVALNLAAGVVAHERLRFDVKAPVYAMSQDPSAGETFGPAPGDLRGTVTFLPLSPRHTVGGGGAGVGVSAYVDAPTGDPTRFLGQPGVAGGGSVSATYEFSRATLSADVGAQFNPDLQLANLNGSDALVASLAVGALASDHVGLTAEVVAQPPFRPPERLVFPAEALAHLKARDATSGLFFTLGGAAGLTSGPGVAAFRAFLGAGIARIQAPPAPDVDVIGAFEVRDACPTEAEVENGWRDGDGCPDTLSALSVEARWQGEPIAADAVITGPDGEQQVRLEPTGLQLDAVPDSRWSARASAGPCRAGEASAVATEGGAAMVIDLLPRLEAKAVVEIVDPAGAGIPGATVLWIGEGPCLPGIGELPASDAGIFTSALGVGTHGLRATAPGYSIHEEVLEVTAGQEARLRVVLQPSLVRVTKERIEILQKVQFETAKAVIKPESDGLLGEVAAILIRYPDLGRVEVGGHTDSQGSDSYNLGLSEERAAAVRTWLIERGSVPADRLTSAGFGETRPIDTNKTPQGREKNRRVEFRLLDQAPTEPPAEGAAP